MASNIYYEQKKACLCCRFGATIWIDKEMKTMILFWILLGLAVVFVVGSLMDSPVRNRAVTKHEVAKEAKEEIAKLEAELAYQQKFLESVRRKLSNERFVANAPEAVVAVERKKESDALSKIESITASLNALKK